VDGELTKLFYGDIKSYVTCDDEWHPRKMQLQLPSLVQTKGISIVFAALFATISTKYGQNDIRGKKVPTSDTYDCSTFLIAYK